MSKATKRYYLHRKVKDQGFEINVRERTILVPFNENGEYNLTKHVCRLRDEFDYGIQQIIV